MKRNFRMGLLHFFEGLLEFQDPPELNFLPKSTHVQCSKFNVCMFFPSNIILASLSSAVERVLWKPI